MRIVARATGIVPRMLPPRSLSRWFTYGSMDSVSPSQRKTKRPPEKATAADRDAMGFSGALAQSWAAAWGARRHRQRPPAALPPGSGRDSRGAGAALRRPGCEPVAGQHLSLAEAERLSMALDLGAGGKPDAEPAALRPGSARAGQEILDGPNRRCAAPDRTAWWERTLPQPRTRGRCGYAGSCARSI